MFYGKYNYFGAMIESRRSLITTERKLLSEGECINHVSTQQQQEKSASSCK